MKFQTFLNEENTIQEQTEQLHALMYMVENLDSLNESFDENLIFEGVASSLVKIGLKIHKGKGIIDYIKSFATGVGKIFLYMIKGDHAKAKAVLKTTKREDVLDFLFKLDLGTLHLFTGPLHMIDAWTGWDLSVKMKSHIQKGANMLNILKNSINKVKDTVHTLYSTDTRKEKRIIKRINSIEQELVV